MEIFLFILAFIVCMGAVSIGGYLIARRKGTPLKRNYDTEEYEAPPNTPYGLLGASSLKHWGEANMPGGSLYSDDD
ncbi:MAG: hypothetical protein ACYC9J_06415 [Sulfuricaulis sp.]